MMIVHGFRFGAEMTEYNKLFIVKYTDNCTIIKLILKDLLIFARSAIFVDTNSMGDAKFEIRIKKDQDGKDIDLNNLSIEASMSLQVILESLTNIAREENGDEFKITIKSGSACLALNAPESKLTVVRDKIHEVTSHKSKDSVYVESLRAIQTTLKNQELQFEIEITEKGKTINLLSDFRQKRKFKKYSGNREQADFYIEYFKGRMFDVGGKSPNIHLEDVTGEVTIQCTEEQARKINTLLYRDILICAYVKRTTANVTRYFCNHFVNEKTFLDFKKFTKSLLDCREDMDSYDLIHYKFKEYLEAEKFGETVKLMRLFNHERYDINELYTILLILKAFKTNEQIAPHYENILEKIKNRLGTETL